jgi:toxin-antitoxin system PIN domain toxin
VIGLLDVNVLVALFDEAHVHHAPAHTWLARNRSSGWASCPMTQNGCIRVLSQPRYPGGITVAEITRRLRAATEAPDHWFWPDSLTLCDPLRFRLDDVATPRPLTDLYLLALAIENHGRLVTFDQGIPLGAVVGAEDRHLVVL